MKVIAILSVLVASTLAAPGYGYGAASDTHMESKPSSYVEEAVETKTAIPPVFEQNKAPVTNASLDLGDDHAGKYTMDSNVDRHNKTEDLKDLGDFSGSVTAGPHSFKGFRTIVDHFTVQPLIPAEFQMSLEQNKHKETNPPTLIHLSRVPY